MEQETHRLRAEGHQRGKLKWHCDVSMFGIGVPMTFDFAGDEWEMMYWARIKTIVVNSGLVQPLPCEELLIAPGSVDNCPLHMKLPEELVKPLIVVRETVMELMGGTKKHSMADMIRLMRKHASELTDLHRSFLSDLSFLEAKDQELLKTRVLGTSI
jgi:hypothetical protein